MDRPISEFCGFDNLISEISECYDIVDWNMSRGDFMEQARKEMFDEMKHWILDARRCDNELYEDNLPEFVKSVKIHFYQKDFMGNNWINKPKIPIDDKTISVGQIVENFLKENYDYNPEKGDWFKYVSYEERE